jgi:Dolichyl-phosphate-mannose-protein mannosyltransferase
MELRSSRARTALTFLLIAAATMAARLPFLLRADRFFDADEAVEGLMARHVLTGEHPLFLWGQRYKGVPEVYLTSAVFRAAGSSVVALKAVTLACFVVFVCLNFKLVERVLSRRIAWIAAALLIAGPPSLVLWTLSGSAEIVMTLLCGAVLLLAVDWWRRSTSSSASAQALLVAGAAVGFGLWVHQYILYYVAALAITAALATPRWRETLTGLLRQRAPGWLRAVMIVLTAVSALYVLLGFMAFMGAGFDVRIAGVHITALHPQKMWWIALAVFAVAIAVSAVAILQRQLLWPAVGFLAGYAPALIGRLGNEGMGAPIARMDLASFRTALPEITGVMLPILFGFRDSAGHPTVFRVFWLVIGVLLGLSCWFAWRQKLTPFFHALLVAAPVMFLISGSYIDAQSYRYLMPMYAALPVVYAIGIDGVRRASRAAGTLLLAFVLLIFAAQQIDWYVRLEPDLESPAIIACLDRAGVRAARASYWRSYKLTFLSGERVIVAPTDGVDRYPPYSALAGSDGPDNAAPCFTPLRAR